MKKCCNNCKHLVYEKDACLNSFPYCSKYEIGPEPRLMNESFDWCDDFEPQEIEPQDNNQWQTLQQNYDNACNDYLKAFCEQYELDYDTDAWVANEVGTIASIADYFFDFQDIKRCVDENVKWDDLIEWYDYNADAYTIGLDTINLKSWLMGCPRTSKEKMAEIFAMRRNLEELIEQENERSKK